MHDDQSNQLEINVFDHDVSGRDDFMGRHVVYLRLIRASQMITIFSVYLPRTEIF